MTTGFVKNQKTAVSVFLLTLSFFLLFTSHVIGDDQPSISFGAPRWGNSIRLPTYNLNTIPITLRNPENRQLNFLISISPEQVAEGTIVNQRLLGIGPGAILRTRDRFLSYATQTYTGDLIDADRGTRYQRQTISSAYETQSIRNRIFIINDRGDFDVAGDMSRLELLTSRVSVSRINAADAPNYWIDYGPSSVIIFVQPDFSFMTDLQFQAVRDFVIGGGTLLFAHPNAIIEAVDTPLEDILPVEPIAIRSIEQLPELEKWFSHYRQAGSEDTTDAMYWPHGLKFLESEPRPDSHTVIFHNEYPLISWQRTGGGLVGAFSFDSSDNAFRLTQAGIPLWNHLLSWSHPHPLATGTAFAMPLERAAERLTGFQAAEAGTVQMILTVNFTLLIVVLIIARIYRRQTTGWLILGAYGLVLTGIIFAFAFGQMRDQPNRNAIILEIMNRQDDRQVGLQSISLFSRQDTLPILETAGLGASFVSVVAPNIDMNPLAIFHQRPADSMQIRRHNDGEELRNFNLSALRRRSLGCAYTMSSHQADTKTAISDTPVLHYGENGLRLSGLNLPEELPPRDTIVYLTGGNGAQLLRSTGNGEWRVETDGQRVFQLNPVLNRIQDFIAGDWLPPNLLVLVYPNRQSRSQTPFIIRDNEEYAKVMYSLQLLPTKETYDEGPIKISAPMIGIQPADRSAQTLVWQDEDSFMSSGGNYLFTAHLPPFLADIRVDTITVDARIHDSTGAAKTEVTLFPFTEGHAGATRDKISDSGIKGMETQPGRFVFETESISDIADPVTGRIYLRLQVSDSRSTEDTFVAGRSLTWRLLELRASVNGTPRTKHPQQTDDGV